MIKVCVGTACHVKGAMLVYDAIRREMKLKDGEETDAQGKYTIEKVSCLGCCTLAPVVQIDQVTYGHVSPSQVDELISDFEKQKNTKTKKQTRKTDGSTIQGEIRIGLGSCCVASGSSEIKEAVEEVVNDSQINVNLKHVGCVGMCHQVPLVEIVPNNQEATLYSKVKAEDVKNIIASHFQSPSFYARMKNKLFSTLENIQTDQELGRY